MGDSFKFYKIMKEVREFFYKKKNMREKRNIMLLKCKSGF